VATGNLHACALLAGGSVQCWGSNVSGQLGEPTYQATYEWSPAPAVPGLGTAVAISAGNVHTCALISNGTVQCWGDNGYGELGNGTTTSSSSPVTVVGLQSVTQVSAGGDFTCALTSNGFVYCWGDNSEGEMGIGATSQTPQSTPGLVKW
jgi:alpha-tubulin suppressor-like RCC1 family protein